MNKSKKIKILKQNNRNRIINKKYSSTIKTLSKLFLKKEKINNLENNLELKEIKNKLFSYIDKAIKKNVIKKRTGARKKSFFTKYILT